MKLWKQNRLDQEWEISIEDLCERFLKSDQCDNDFLDYYGLHQAIVAFVTSRDGLRSSMDIEHADSAGHKDLNEAYEHIKAVMKERGIWFTKQETV